MNEKEIWYRQLGFHNNPFSIKPASYFDDLMGYDTIIRKVNNSIATRKVVFVEGEYGQGKSSLLKHIINRFGGQGKIIYFSCNRIEHSLNIEKLLKGRYGFLGNWFNLKPKNMILLLDEAQWLTKDDYSRLVKYYRSGYFSSIVFVATAFNPMTFPDGFNGILQNVKIGEISEADAVTVVRKRVGKLPLLSDDIIKDVFSRTGKNMRLLLKSCELLCRYAYEHNEEHVTEGMVNELMGRHEPPAKAEEPVKRIREELPKAKIEPVRKFTAELPKEEIEEDALPPYEERETAEEEKPEGKIEESFGLPPEEKKIALEEEKPRAELDEEKAKIMEEIREVLEQKPVVEDIPAKEDKEEKRFNANPPTEELYY